jgi:signal transduction histidine kinase/DNA-binding response OmpR family regulator
LAKHCLSILFVLLCWALKGQTPLQDTLKTRLDAAHQLYAQGDYAKSAALALNCIQMAEKERVPGIVGKAYYCLARGAFQLQDFDKGLEYARTSLAVSQREQNTGGIGDAYNVMAVMMLATNQLDSAYRYGEQAVKHYTEAGNAQGAAVAYTKLGHVFNIKGEYEKATPYYLRSYDMAKYDTLSSAFMTANLCLASNYIYRKKPDAALPHTLKTYQIAQRLGMFYEQSTALYYLSGIYELKGDYRSALEYQRQYTESRDSVMKAERVRQVKELEAEYETVKKENAIQQLEREKLRQRVIIWAGLAILTLLLFVALQIYTSYRRRTTELRAESLERERLNEMDAFKSRFFTNITHEFRTPLTVILGNLDLMKIEVERSGAAISALLLSKISTVKRSGENLLRLINEILDLAKLESNTLQMNYVQGDVLTYLRYIAESMHSLANTQNVMLRVESEEAAIVMDYDPERLMQIVHNLLSNAVKFTPSGGRVVLAAKTLEGFKTLPTLTIAVADTGAGIAAEELPRIFDRFFQAKNQQHAKAGGAGIGLSLTKELVKVMGGDIRAESAVGKGTTFVVTLPITNTAPQADASLPAVTSGEGEPTQQINNSIAQQINAPHLLIVEDNPDVVEYLGACLEGQYQLDFAYNGRAGIENALENVPDIIISDVMMPEKDGFELCDTLKNDERTSHIPIVLLTARATAADRIAGLRRGADAYLAKPFYPEELQATLANLVALRQRLQDRYAQATAAPLAPATEPGLQIEDAFLAKVRAVVEARLSDPDLEMPQLERALAMSRSQIFRKIKALTGKSPSLYIRSIRLAQAQELLRSTALTVSEIAYDTGFSSPQYFSDTFMEEFGVRPSEARG